MAFSSGQTRTTSLNVKSSTPGTYSVIVSATLGSVSRAINVTVLVSGFTIATNPATISVPAGSSGSSSITLTSLYGFFGTVNLNIQGLPGGTQAKFNPQSVTLSQGGTSTSSLVITTSSNTLVGNYTLTLIGSGPNGLTQTVKVALIVTGYLTVSATPVTVNLLSGQSVNVQINVKSFGLKGTASLNASASPSGLKTTLNPTSLSFNPGQSQSSTLTVSSVIPGTYTVIVTARMGLVSSSVTVTVNVADFSITASPSQLSIPVGSSASSNITLTSLYGFTGTVNLSPSSSPAGLSLSLSSNSVSISPGSAKTATLTIRTSATTLPGTYTITLKATSGSLTHTITIKVTVTIV
jgi:uncharacterized membrane protein